MWLSERKLIDDRKVTTHGQASKLIALGFGIVGLILLVASIFVYFNTRAFIDRSVITTGTVVDMSAEWDEDHDRVYYPIIEFETATGERASFKSNVSSTTPDDDIGNTVPVRYDPADPDNAGVNTFLALWFATIFLVIIGVVFTVLGFGAWFYLVRHPELAEREVIKSEPGKFVISFDR